MFGSPKQVMAVKKTWLVALAFLGCFSLTGCSLTYLAKNAYYQGRILNKRTPISEVLAQDSVSTETREKLQLALRAKKFGEEKLGLEKSDNYSSFVQLEKPYVTWVVRAAKIYQLEAHKWWFPIVGSVPYKGYFTKEGALDEAKNFDPEKYDTYVRGVSAYSTLGWFDDPILSSMLNYKDHDLVELIIHESVHATIYIKSEIDFNERLATFLGREGTRLFYADQPDVLKLIDREQDDDRIFSEFITGELKSLKAWYKNTKNLSKETKAERLLRINKKFTNEVHPQMKTTNYDYFKSLKLNNALLLSYETYVADLNVFRKAYSKFKGFSEFLSYCKSLEKVDDPEAELKSFSEAK